MNAKEAKAKTIDYLRDNSVYSTCMESINKAIWDGVFLVEISILNTSSLKEVRQAQLYLLEKGYECSVVDNTTIGYYNFVISWQNA